MVSPSGEALAASGKEEPETDESAEGSVVGSTADAAAGREEMLPCADTMDTNPLEERTANVRIIERRQFIA